MTLETQLTQAADKASSKTSTVWKLLEDTPHPAFYTSESGARLYITDRHSNRLRKNGEQYSAGYRAPGSSEYHTIDRADSIEELDLEEVPSITAERVVAEELEPE